MKYRLRIKKHNNKSIKLEVLEGADHFGFGTFLCDIDPEEIECDKFSKEAMLNAVEREGLNGLEIWKDNRIAWGDPSHKIIMPIDEISKAEGSDTWLKKIKAK